MPYSIASNTEGYRLTDRNTLIRQDLPISSGRGLEMGPLCSPIVQRSQGNILYADFLSTAELTRQHAENPAYDTAAIVEVDIVLAGKPLEQALAPFAPFDYIVASHVFEHIANPIRWLQQLSGALCPGGQISLAIPDKRYTFDYLRVPTRFSELLANFHQGVDFPTALQALDNNLNVVKLDANAVWNGTLDEAQLEHHFSPEVAVSYWQATIAKGIFADCHCTVWTYDHFLQTFDELRRLGLTDLELHHSHAPPPQSIEFFATLRKPG